MIANVIYNLMSDEFASRLKPSVDFFLEKGSGNKNVVVKTVGTNNPVKSINEMRFTKIYVLINGWKIDEAMAFANEIVKFIERVRGTYSIGDDEYLVKEMSVAPYPFPVDSTRTDSTSVISFGIGAYYIEI